MVNIIFLIVFLTGLVYGVISGRGDLILNTILTAPKSALFVFIEIYVMILFWGGILEICKQSGLLKSISSFFSKIISPLFPKLKKESLALQYISMNLVCNMLSMGSAATPFGLKAMDELSILNDKSQTASDEMITFLCLNVSSICFIPTTILAILNDNGCTNPGKCIPYIMVVSIVSTFVSIILDKVFRKIC
jgi:spore maturation protein A